MKKLILLSLSFLVLFACRKNVEEQFTVEETPTPPIVTIDWEPDNIEVNGTLMGLVKDEAGLPVVGASVKLGSLNSNTDDNGIFLFKDVTLNAAGTYVVVEQAGYFPGSTRFFPREGSNNFTSIQLLEKTSIGTIDAASGGQVSSAEGIKLDFPAGSIVTSNGQSYEGVVNVAARWINPEADNLDEIMPGNLQGVNAEVEEVSLESYGMMAVELTGSNGQVLNLGNNEKAALTFPVPDALMSSAPAEIPLWYFEETLGIWVEDGQASLEGNNYVGEVSHFSFWNCDAPFPLINFTAQVVAADGTPIAGATVVIIRSTGWNGYGTTDGEGYVGGKIPANEELTIKIYSDPGCNNTAYTQDIGPFSADTDLGVITINTPELMTISGNLLDCNNDPVTNGYLTIELENGGVEYLYVEDGTFSIAVLNCAPLTGNVSILGIDLNTLEQGTVQTFPYATNIDAGNIVACGNILTEYMIITLNGETQTTVEIYGYASTSGDSSYVQGNFSPNQEGVYLSGLPAAVGTYTTIDPNFNMYIFQDFSFATASPINFSCSNTLCGVTEIVITDTGTNTGDIYAGTVTGVNDFTDSGGNMYNNIPYVIQFRLIVD